MSETQNCIWPGSSPNHLSDDVFIMLHIFQIRYSISVHYDEKDILAACPSFLCCLQADTNTSGNLSTKAGKTCVCYWAITAILDNYKGRKYCGLKMHKLQMVLSHGCPTQLTGLRRTEIIMNNCLIIQNRWFSPLSFNFMLVQGFRRKQT